MDIRIEGLHEKALIRLMERNGEKTSVGMMRLLIRDEARKQGVWPAPIMVDGDDEASTNEVLEGVEIVP